MPIAARATSLLAVVAFVVISGTPASGQETGKLQGRVTGAGGQAVPGAQVVVLGTRLGNITTPDGHYFINNVPAGVFDIEARSIGYAPVSLRQQRVLAGQTTTLDVSLTEQAVSIAALEVIGERAPLVPRDQVASKNIITGEEVDRLPVDDMRRMLTLQPGVLETNRDKGVSIRGGRAGEEAVYVDGVLIRNYRQGASAGRRNLRLSTNALAEVDVITGGFSAEYGEAQSGIVNYVTRTMGRRWTGSASFATDEPFPERMSVGTNRLELSLGGPIRGQLSLFGAITAQGNRFSNTGKLYRDMPIYYIDGVDTSVTVPVYGTMDEQTVVIPAYSRYSGSGRVPASSNDIATLTGKLTYAFGSGSSLFVSHDVSRVQYRSLFGMGDARFLYNPASYMGEISTNRAWVWGLTQNFFRRAESALSVEVRAALTRDEGTSGVLDHDWEVRHRAPVAGFTFSNYRFLVQNDCHGRSGCIPMPLDQQLLDLLAACTPVDPAGHRATPFVTDDSEPLRKQPFWLNPYGIASAFPTTGVVGPYAYARESDKQLRLTVDWQAGRYHRIKIGGDYTAIAAGALSYAATNEMPTTAYLEWPRRANLFVQDRIDLGDLVVEAGLRIDRFDPNTRYTDLRGYFAPDSPHATFRAPREIAVSPRLGVSFPVTPRSTFRLSYGHFVRTPDLGIEFLGKNMNHELNGAYARPLQMPRTIAFEFGYRQLLAPDFVLDLSAFQRDSRGDLSVRRLLQDDPTNPGIDSVYIPSPTNADFGTARGVDLRFDRRFGRFARGMLAYGYVNARNTGSDPWSFSWLQRAETNASVVLGVRPDPPQSVHLTEESRAHTITGTLSITLPDAAASLPPALRGLGAYGTVYLASGLPYTRLEPLYDSFLTGPPITATTATLANGDLQTARTPWTRSVDLRVTRGVTLAGIAAQIYLDARNLFDYTNKERVSLTTGDIADGRTVESLTSALVTSAGGGIQRQIDLHSLKAAGSIPNAVDLVAMRRAEALFGNGDMIFTLDEQRQAFSTAVLNDRDLRDLVGPGRRLRMGVELSF